MGHLNNYISGIINFTQKISQQGRLHMYTVIILVAIQPFKIDKWYLVAHISKLQRTIP